MVNDLQSTKRAVRLHIFFNENLVIMQGLTAFHFRGTFIHYHLMFICFLFKFQHFSDVQKIG